MSIEREVRRQLACRSDGVVDLNQRSLTDVHMGELAPLLNTLPIRQLFLWRNNIGDEGCKALAVALASNATITDLVMIGNNVSAGGCHALARHLGTNTTLTSINLNGNDVDAAGNAALIAAGWKVPAGWRWQYQRDVTLEVRWGAEQEVLARQAKGFEVFQRERAATDAAQGHLAEVAAFRAALAEQDRVHVETVSELLRQQRVENQRHADDIADARNVNATIPSRVDAMLQEVRLLRAEQDQQREALKASTVGLQDEQRKEMLRLANELNRVTLRATSEKAAHESARAVLLMQVGDLKTTVEAQRAAHEEGMAAVRDLIAAHATQATAEKGQTRTAFVKLAELMAEQCRDCVARADALSHGLKTVAAQKAAVVVQQVAAPPPPIQQASPKPIVKLDRAGFKAPTDPVPSPPPVPERRRSLSVSFSSTVRAEDPPPIPPRISESLTDEQRRDIRGAFTLSDTDGSGHIDAGQMQQGMKVLGFEAGKEEIERMLAEVIDEEDRAADLGNYPIAYEQFLEIMAAMMQGGKLDGE